MSLDLESTASNYVSFGGIWGSESLAAASIEAWFRLETVAGGGFIVHMSGSATTQQRFSMREIAGPVAQTVVRPLNAGTSTTLSGSKTLVVGKTYHCVTVADIAGGSISFYLQGVLDTSVTGLTGNGWGGTFDSAASAGQVIGARSDGTTNYLDGIVDGVRFYNYALTAQQVYLRYRNVELATAPLHAYNFIGTPGSTAAGAGSILDSGSGSALNGTPVASPVYRSKIIIPLTGPGAMAASAGG